MEESSLRVNYSHNESSSKPLYIPGTDVLVSEVAARATDQTPEQVISETQTINISDTWSASNTGKVF